MAQDIRYFCISRRKTYIFLFFMFVGSAIYSNSLHVPFMFDDARNIQHPELKVDDFSIDKLRSVLLGGELKERPIANLSFALNYFVNGYDLPGYHVVNIVLHILAAFFLYLLLQQTIHLPVNQPQYVNTMWIAEATAFIWLVHPIATQSVTYIVQRMTVLATLFYVASLYFYVLGRKRQIAKKAGQSNLPSWSLFSLSICCSALAIGSKEIASTMPFVVFLYEWFFFQNLRWRWIQKRMIWLAGIPIFIGVLAFVYLDGHPLDYIMHGCDWRDFTLEQRLLTQPRVVWHYISLLVFPQPGRLVLDYNFPVSTSLFQPWTTCVSIIGIIGVICCALFRAKKDRLLAFCVMWFFGNLVIESSVICLEMVFEHRTYLPSTFFYLFCVIILSRLIRSRFVFISILLVVGCLFSFWTYERNKSWQTSVIFWQDSVDKQPGKARSHNNLGAELYKIGQLEQARNEFNLALAADSGYPLAYNSLGLIEFREGNYEKAGNYFKRAIELLPRYVDAMINLATVDERLGELSRAEEQLKEAIKIAPKYPLANERLGRVLLNAEKPEEAIQYLQFAAEKNPDDAELLTLLGDTYFKIGQAGPAKDTYEKSLKLKDDQATVHYNLARIFTALGDQEKTREHYERAIESASFFIAAHYNLANLLFQTKRLPEAEEHYQKVIGNIPLISNSLNNMGMIKLRQGRMNEAEMYFKAAIRVMPENEMAKTNLERIRADAEK